MKKILWGMVVVVVLILLTKQLTASGKTEGPVPEGAYRFYYYPTSNFYYDVAQGNFVYTLDGGRSWEAEKAASPRTATAFRDRKVIDSPVPQAWKYNSEHRAKYGGVLTDYRERKERVIPPAAAYKEGKKDKERKKEKKDKGRWKNFPKKMKEKIKGDDD